MRKILRRSRNKAKAGDRIEIEPGADKRLANILKRALNTPPPRHVASPKRDKAKRKG